MLRPVIILSGIILLSTLTIIGGALIWGRSGHNAELTYVDIQDRIITVDLSTDLRVNLPVSQSREIGGIVNALRWSPDGRELAFDAGSEIYIYRLADSRLRQITNFQSYQTIVDPTWSPDSQRLAFISLGQGRNRQIGISAANKTHANPVTTAVGRRTFSGLTWSPRGDLLAYSTPMRAAWRVMTLETATGETRVHNLEGAHHITNPVWSPDGSRLVVQVNNDGQRDLYLLDVDSDAFLRLTDSPGLESYPEWSPDGDHIAFVSDQTDNLELYIMTLATGEIWRITDRLDTDTVPRWSPDGRWIAFYAERSGGSFGLYVIDLHQPDNPPRFIGPMFLQRRDKFSWRP